MKVKIIYTLFFLLGVLTDCLAQMQARQSNVIFQSNCGRSSEYDFSGCEMFRLNNDTIRFKREKEPEVEVVGGEDTLDEEFPFMVSLRD